LLAKRNIAITLAEKMRSPIESAMELTCNDFISVVLITPFRMCASKYRRKKVHFCCDSKSQERSISLSLGLRCWNDSFGKPVRKLCSRSASSVLCNLRQNRSELLMLRFDRSSRARPSGPSPPLLQVAGQSRSSETRRIIASQALERLVRKSEMASSARPITM